MEVLETLADQAKYLNGYGIEDFCSQTIKNLSEWKEFLPTDAKLNGAEEKRTLPSCQEMLKPLTQENHLATKMDGGKSACEGGVSKRLEVCL